MQKWEYAQIEVWPETMKVQIVRYGKPGFSEWTEERNQKLVEAKNRDASLIAVLEVLGAEGWELITGPVLPKEGGGSFLMKRPAGG